ncbi:PRC-barrel domain-containing protein [Alcaligenaceae bacterium]|nr:PRC-barrel domain-containing protein [Alcaligenaceae bacterium]
MMTMKTLTTALTVSLPLIFGGAYAQTTTAPGDGNNRSGDGGAMTTNQAPASPDAGTTAPDAGTTAPAPGTVPPVPGAGDAGTVPGTTAPAPGADMQSDSAASTEAITGWSAKNDIIGKSVFNENDEKVGDVNDVVLASDGRTMFLLIGAGGFLGMGEKNVAVPFDRFERSEDRILLSGYSKEQLKALPEVRTQR